MNEVAADLGAAATVDVAFVATPVGSVAGVARALLDAGTPLVTDVGSTKGAIVQAVDDPRFIGGHPMAGSEQEGIDGARSDMFGGAVWVLTPRPDVDDRRFAALRALVVELGADPLVLDAQHHDALVAVVSHVPHLTAATLMTIADEASFEHRALLRLAAGGFRDMTRIAAGHPGIWPEICAANRTAITSVLDGLIQSLGDVRQLVDEGDQPGLLQHLERARAARVNLPTGVPTGIELAELRVTVQDQPGELARITTLATEIDVNIYDLEIAHSSEGARGVLILVVGADRGERLVGALMAQGYRPHLRPFES